MQSSQPQYQNIQILPLGAGQEVGRSCIVCKIKDKTIVFDTGIHMQYNDMQKYPDFKYLCTQNNNDINKYIDIVIITHFHLDHCGGLPYLTEYFKYNGPIYATMPTKAMIPYMLEDFRKVSTDLRKQKQDKDNRDKDRDRDRDRDSKDRDNYNYNRDLNKDKDKLWYYTATQAKQCADKITSISLQQTITYKGVKITPYYGGHVLGAGMFLVQYEGLSVMYTGDYNSYADRHLNAAYAPRLNPNIVITETTYATTIRDTKRDRQRKMLKIVSETVQNGGKVLIPVFALGRAQELSVLLQTYWNRTENQVPVYFSAGLIEKANFYYKLFVQWQNQKIKQDFLTNNLFNFKKVKPFDKSLIRADFPYVLFATPGMLHGGTSLQVFKEWCANPKNTIIIPGYCVPGTFGNKLINGIRKFNIDMKQYQVNMKVQNISFSAHADAKGIINLIRHINAQNIVFVHGDKQKMEVFQSVVKEQLGKPVYRPANKQKILIPCTVRRTVMIKDIGSIPKQPGMNGYLLRKQNKNMENTFKLIEQRNLLRQLNLMQDILGCCGSVIVEDQVQTILNIKDETMIAKMKRDNLQKQFNVMKLENKISKLNQSGQIIDQGGEIEDINELVKVQEKQKEQFVSKKQEKQMRENDQGQRPQQGPKIRIQGDLKNILKFMEASRQN